MPDSTYFDANASAITKVLEWWNGARLKWARLDQIGQLASEDVAWLAHDIGVAPEEFLEMIRQPGGTADLLSRRLQSLELDPQSIRRLSEALLADIWRTCASCKDKDRCRSDFATSANPEGWESYCPNAGTFNTLT